MSDTETDTCDNSKTNDAGPPDLSTVLPSIQDIKARPKEPNLPIDVLLVTVKDCEFLACYSELKDSFRWFFDGIGYVYFPEDVGSQQGKVKVALMRCHAGSTGPGCSLLAVKNAVHTLRPKAVISVGACSGLNPKETKLGDVVVPAKLTTYASKVVTSSGEHSAGISTCVSGRFLNIIPNCADGWRAPLKKTEDGKIKVHCSGEFLSGPEKIKAERRRKELLDSHPFAVGVGMEAEGVFTAAFETQMEWLIVKGIADYADGEQVNADCWKAFASVMAASLVSHILNDPDVFLTWPHFQGASCDDENPTQTKRMCPAQTLQQTASITQHHEAVNNYSMDMKKSIKRQTEFPPRLFDNGPSISRMRTDEIFTNLRIQIGRKSVKDNKNQWPGRRDRLARYGRVSKRRIKHCSEIFSIPTANGNSPRSILVTGKAGIGKTLLCQKALRDWANGKLFQKTTNTQTPNFKFAYLLTFKSLNLLDGKEFTLKEMLKHSPLLDDQCLRSSNDDFVDYVLNHPEEVWITVDGFDEYSQQGQKYIASDRRHEEYINSCDQKMKVEALCAKLIRGKIFTQATVMITSRPDESDKLRGIKFDRYVDVMGFAKQEVTEYIKKYFRHNESLKVAVLEHITKNENLVSFAHIPVLCALMCSYFEYILEKSSSATDLPISMSQLYNEVLNIFERNHIRKKISNFGESTLDIMSELSANLLLKRKYLFTEEEMKGLSSEDIESLRKCGLLHCGPPVRVSFSQTTKYFCFSHLTLQEYLSARWFVNKEKIPLHETVSALVYQFIAGILSKKKDKKLMNKLLDKIPLPDGKNYLLVAKCLSEHQDIEFARNYYRNYLPFGHEELSFSDVHDVDCISLLFLIDVFSSLNKEIISLHQATSQQRLICVKDLSVRSSSLTLSGVRRILRFLQSNVCAVTNLKLWSCGLNDECMECISELWSSEHKLETDVASLSKVLQQSTCQLTSLVLGNNQITDDGVATLCEGLKQSTCQLTSLDLGGNKITDAGVASLSKVLKQSACQLTSLDLGGNKITDAGVASLREVLKQSTCQLTSLNLADNQMTVACVPILAEALKHSKCQLTSLELDNCQISDDSVAILSEVLKTSTCKLTSLELSVNQITDAGASSLSEALKQSTCKLTSLNLGSNQITDAGASSLSEALKQSTCKLTSLVLSFNQITDAGASSLNEALNHQNRLLVFTSSVLCSDSREMYKKA